MGSGHENAGFNGIQAVQGQWQAQNADDEPGVEDVRASLGTRDDFRFLIERADVDGPNSDIGPCDDDGSENADDGSEIVMLEMSNGVVTNGC